jgi:site-specific DNA-methyltransferase (adenine-specific)
MNHQLIVDDTFAAMARIPDNSIDMILADLPYGTTAAHWDSLLDLDLLWSEYRRVARENAAIILTAAQPFTWKLCASNPSEFRYELIWEKPNGTNPMLAKKQPMRCHENILVFYRRQPTYNPQMTSGAPYCGFASTTKGLGEVYGKDTRSRHRSNPEGTRYPRSVQKFKQDRSGHPTKKPVDLFRWLIRTYSNESDTILDNTCGEGTTVIAAALENRNAIGIDANAEYIARARRDLETALCSN